MVAAGEEDQALQWRTIKDRLRRTVTNRGNAWMTIHDVKLHIFTAVRPPCHCSVSNQLHSNVDGRTGGSQLKPTSLRSKREECRHLTGIIHSLCVIFRGAGGTC